MKVIIGSDLNNLEYKNLLKNYLVKKGYEVVDKSENKNLNSIEISNIIAKAMLNKEGERAIIIDENGTVPFIVASKHKGIVCAQVADEHSAKMTRDHNNTNIIAIGANITSLEISKSISVKFIESEYSGGRHQIRVDMLNKMA